MCGIVGYAGSGKALEFVLSGLAKLEYRGYDSAGIALCQNGSVEITKYAGRLSRLLDAVSSSPSASTTAVGHTRWATHGRPTDINAHPHTDSSSKFAVVHNGIIENYTALGAWLRERGHKFVSDTDTEVIPHLIAEFYEGDLVAAVRKAVEKLRGSYALAIVSSFEPETIIGVRKDSPLIVGLGNGENYLASDIPAVMAHTRKIYVLEDDEMAVIRKDGVEVTSVAGTSVLKDVFEIKWDPVQAERGGYPHFMLKEIHEQPKAIRDTLSGRISEDGKSVVLDEISLPKQKIRELAKMSIVACGTAYHAGMVTKYLIERLARIPVEVDVASEFRYRDPIVAEGDLVLVISQSGETSDTLAALREAKRRGAHIIAITNVVGSSVSREAHDVIYTWAGPEIAVASTKAYTTQLVAGTLLAVYLAHIRAQITQEEVSSLVSALLGLPEKAKEALLLEADTKQAADYLVNWNDAFFIGRGLDYMLGLEGQLKLKEISYIHAEGYAAGELKHGTLALITEGVPVIALATQPALMEKMLSNIAEVNARGGHVIAVSMGEHEELSNGAKSVISVPQTHPYVAPVLCVIPLQLIAYYAAVQKGADVDKPRNLAKSVTVE